MLSKRHLVLAKKIHASVLLSQAVLCSGYFNVTKNLGKFEYKFENILHSESETQIELINEKSLVKMLPYCPF
jgi:hypothetical protein